MNGKCPSCGRGQTDGLLCKSEVLSLHADLKGIPALVEDLAIAISKQSRLTAGGRGGKGSVHERWPIDINASAAAWDLENTLERWSAEIARVSQQPAPKTAIRSAVLLTAEISTVRGYEHVSQLVDQIRKAIQDAHEQVLGPRERSRIKVGPCPELNRDGTNCQGAVTAYIPRQDNAPSRMQCNADADHSWNSIQFYRTGKRIYDRAEQLRRRTA